MSVSPTERLDRIDSLFDAAIDLPPEEQTAFVERACSDDEAICARVLELVRAYRSEGALDSPAARVAAGVVQAASALGGPVPERIGPFRVGHEIGRGGMGRVFLGERADGQFEQRVAIKLIQHGAPGIVRRFVEERKLLARLSHPGIARLLDGGITPSGLPYFVMELVEGEPIDAYCQSHDLSIDRRLELVASVCEAVTYAHQHLIIHRDLKPTNILVSASGQVKLLDFGIAKLLRTSESDEDDTLRTELQAMTPEFAAPEQILGRPVTTATDVYSLGVLLYFLLAGERPYDVRGKTPAELERIVCEEVPPRPSTRAPASVRRRIQGDLDLIVMTALQKEEHRRYQSPAALAQDLQRFREGLAIAARTDSAAYRAGKFIGRHRVGVALTALAMLGLGGAASRERVLRNRAEVEARKASEVKQFLVSVFDKADPDGWADPDDGRTTARQLLDRGAARIDSTLAEQPEVQAELRSVLGRVYTRLGVYDKATALLERSLHQRESLRERADSSVAETMDLLGEALVKRNKLDDAEPLLRRALVQRRALFGSSHAATATTIDNLAILLMMKSKLEEAEPLYREALVIRRSVFGDSSVEFATSLNNLGLLVRNKGLYAEAESLHQRALDIKLRRLGEGHPVTARAMQNFARTLQMRGKYEQAEVYHRRALATKRRALGDLHPSVSVSMTTLANLLAHNLGRVREGESLAREALALDRKSYGESNEYVAASLVNLGVILRVDGNFAEAEATLREALTMQRRLLGDRDMRVPYNVLQLGLVLAHAGDGVAAIPLLRQSVSLYRELLGDDDQLTIVTTTNLAWVLADYGFPVEAESIARGALARIDEKKPEHGAAFVVARTTLGKALLAQDRVDEALPPLEEAVARAGRQFGKGHWRTADTELTYGKALLARGRLAEGEPLVRSARAALETQRRAQPRLAAQARAAVAKLGR